MNITKVFHADHGINEATIQIALALLRPEGFFASTVVLPSTHPSVLCALYGPIMGDDPVPDVCVIMRTRTPDRPPSRLVPWPQRLSRELTVIGAVDDAGSVTIFTAYGGKLAPREPGDVTLTEEERTEAVAFWTTHALAIHTSSHPDNVP